MNKKEYEALREKAGKFKYSSFTYSEYVNQGLYVLKEDDEDGIVLYGYNKEYRMNEIQYAFNYEKKILEASKKYKSSLIQFIPADLRDDMKKIGCTEYGYMCEYWADDLDKCPKADSYEIGYIKDSKVFSDITKSCTYESREFRGEEEKFVKEWILGTDPFLKENDNGKSDVICYKEDGIIKGVVFVAIYESEKSDSKILWIRELAVDKSYQHKGIGRKLLLMAFKYGEENKANKSFLMADELNEHAIKLYESLGFRKNGEYQLDFITSED